MLNRDLILFYSRAFTNDDTNEARRMLKSQKTHMRVKDVKRISFYTGLIISTSISLLYVLTFMEQKSEQDWLTKLGSGIVFYYFTLILIYILFATGLCIQVFLSYQINYPFIFEIDVSYRLIHHQFYRLGMGFFSLWLACLTMQIAWFKQSDDNIAYFTYAMVILFGTLML